MTYGYDPNYRPGATPPRPPGNLPPGNFPPGNLPPGQPWPPQQQPWPPGPPPQPPAKPRSRLLWVLLGVGGLIGALCCGGFGVLAYFGLELISTEVRNQVRDHPVVVQHIGVIESFEVSFIESAATNDDETFVYHVKGTKGSGVLTAKHVTNAAGEEEILWAKLRLRDGQEHDLVSPSVE